MAEGGGPGMAEGGGPGMAEGGGPGVAGGAAGREWRPERAGTQGVRGPNHDPLGQKKN